MAERRRQRKRPEAHNNAEHLEKPDKVEYEIAKYLRSNLPPKQTSLLGHKVDYFIASKAVDLLMQSKWAKVDKKTDEAMFPSRESVIDFMNTMLIHQFFHRAKAIIVKKPLKLPVNKTQKDQQNDSTDDGNKSEASKKASKQTKTSTDEQNQVPAEKKKEKKKVKLDMHPEQIFVDLNEPYVWIYDYIPMKTWLIGGCLVIAAIAICLFPLWPQTVRNYVYYLTIAVAVFIFLIIALALLKLVVFALVWLLTLGNHHLWILPNLTEDVGFLESFWPLYKHECKSNTDSSNKKANKTKLTKDDQGKKSESSIQPKPDEQSNSEDDKDDGEESDENEQENEETSTKPGKRKKKSSTNGFEILDSKECSNQEIS